MKLPAKFWPVVLGLYGVIGGGVSLAGWALDLQRLTDWFNKGISIQPNTALAVVFAGLGLLALAAGKTTLTRALGVATALLGAMALFETVTGITLGSGATTVDTLLRFGRNWGDARVVAPGRMGPPAAMSSVLLGVALLLATATTLSARVRCTGPAAAGLATVISTTSLLGYVFGASALYTIPTATAIALQSATFILALSLGAILSVPQFGPGRLIYADTMAGALFRRTLPALVLVPLVLGFVRLEGQRLGWYDLEFGTAARTVAEIAVLIFFVWLAAGDISKVEYQRQRIENQLVESEALLRTVTEEAEIGLVIIGADYRYIYANRAYCNIVHADPVTIIGRHPREILPDAYDTRIRPKIDAAFAGETVRYELEMPATQQFLSVTYQPIVRDGKIDRVIVAIVDTTERRRIEDALQHSRNELQLAARRKDEFLMTLAHELRNPLAPIRTAVDLMKRIGPGKDTTQPQEVIDRQLKLMVRLLDDLLDVGRIERDTLILRKERADVGTLIQHAAEISQPLADRFRQQLVVHPLARPITIEADPARIEQVIANLLNNACRFTPGGGRIDVWAERDGEFAVIRVRDDGIGIEPAHLARIFELFAQLDQSSERAQGGLGIGLHLVKRLVQLHGGTVEARSEGISYGSEFIVRLPALADGVTREPAHARHSDAAVAPRRILIVDDNVDAAVALSMLLNVIGHHTHVVHTGPDAIDAAQAIQPDVILLDLGLPGMNGFEVCRAIRASITAAPPLVIALTGWGQDSDRRKSRDSGFDHHLVKPVDYDELAELLARAAG